MLEISVLFTEFTEQNSEHEDYYLILCDAVYYDRSFPTYRNNVSCPTSIDIPAACLLLDLPFDPEMDGGTYIPLESN
jgi:hypothetical protein